MVDTLSQVIYDIGIIKENCPGSSILLFSRREKPYGDDSYRAMGRFPDVFYL
jgi:hypothetical protein